MSERLTDLELAELEQSEADVVGMAFVQRMAAEIRSHRARESQSPRGLDRLQLSQLEALDFAANPTSLGNVHIAASTYPPCPNCGATGNHSGACYREQHERAVRAPQLSADDRIWFGEIRECVAANVGDDDCRKAMLAVLDRLIGNAPKRRGGGE